MIIAAPILAVPFFIVGFGLFLAWRGKQRGGAAWQLRRSHAHHRGTGRRPGRGLVDTRRRAF